MKKESRTPTRAEMQALAAFLPRLYAPGFAPVQRWQGGWGADGLYRLPYPDYHPLVQDFFREAARECWLDYNYRPEDAARMIGDPALIQAASVAQVKTMLTFCLRFERFADGHWAEMIQTEVIRRLLLRIEQLSQEAGAEQQTGES